MGLRTAYDQGGRQGDSHAAAHGSRKVVHARGVAHLLVRDVGQTGRQTSGLVFKIFVFDRTGRAGKSVHRPLPIELDQIAGPKRVLGPRFRT